MNTPNSKSTNALRLPDNFRPVVLAPGEAIIIDYPHGAENLYVCLDDISVSDIGSGKALVQNTSDFRYIELEKQTPIALPEE